MNLFSFFLSCYVISIAKLAANCQTSLKTYRPNSMLVDWSKVEFVFAQSQEEEKEEKEEEGGWRKKEEDE